MYDIKTNERIYRKVEAACKNSGIEDVDAIHMACMNAIREYEQNLNHVYFMRTMLDDKKSIIKDSK